MVRGGRERQLATIFKYSGDQFENKILVFNRKKEDYLDEYQIPPEDVFYLSSKKTHKRVGEIRQVFKTQRPDIIYVWGSFEYMFCFLLAPATKAKLINGSIRHGIVLFNKKQVSRFLFLHLSKYIVANSKAGLKANRLKRGYVLYNGIDKKFTAPVAKTDKKKLIREVFDDYNGEIILVSVANLVPYKDYFSILHALKNAKDNGLRFKYLAIGEGPMREQLEVELLQLDLDKEVKFVGRKSNVQNYLKAGDVFIHSSKGEGCSNAILEAMAASLPVIASDTGGTSEITGNENGRLFQYQDAEQLTTAIESVISDKEGLSEKGKRSRKIIEERFTVEKMISNYVSIIMDILKVSENER
jgi:glycosyltransferase involved in cell wall biosynthesis